MPILVNLFRFFSQLVVVSFIFFHFVLNLLVCWKAPIAAFGSAQALANTCSRAVGIFVRENCFLSARLARLRLFAF